MDKPNGSIVRFRHERGGYTFDFHRSLDFRPDSPIDAAFHEKALAVMADTEKGIHVNRSEDRMVGHFWLRDPELAPEEGIAAAVRQAVEKCKAWSDKVHRGLVCNEAGEAFLYLAAVGIGGSQLGFQFISKALADEGGRMKVFTLDNTDPDTPDSLIREIGEENLDKVLFVVASKSGGTTEIRNIHTVFEKLYEAKGLRFGRHAVAVTMEDSRLYRYAKDRDWLDIFPVWDWVGGRFSVLSPVGLLPLTLLGVDADALLDGARAMDALTRGAGYPDNPAMLLAYYLVTQADGNGKHHMVVLPYKDKLDLWGKYLQQLFMESLGKTLETEAGPRHCGLSVFGNKGTTDQHSYVQQLLAGHNDFFALFFSVLGEKGEWGTRTPVEDGGVTMGDYLLAFCHGTMNAMRARGRESMLITLDKLDAFSLGGLIALFERAVGFYAVYAGLNPYDQPQVEEGKKSAGDIILMRKRLGALLEASDRAESGASASVSGPAEQGVHAPAGPVPASGPAPVPDVDALMKAFAPEEYTMLYYLLCQAKERGIIGAEEAELDKLLRS